MTTIGWRGSKSINLLNGPFFPFSPLPLHSPAVPAIPSFRLQPFIEIHSGIHDIPHDCGRLRWLGDGRTTPSPFASLLISPLSRHQPSCRFQGSRRRGDGISISISRKSIMRYYRRYMAIGEEVRPIVCHATLHTAVRLNGIYRSALVFESSIIWRGGSPGIPYLLWVVISDDWREIWSNYVGEMRAFVRKDIARRSGFGNDRHKRIEKQLYDANMRSYVGMYVTIALR